MEINLNNQLDNKIALYIKCDFCKENIHGACLNCSDYDNDIINNVGNEYHFCDILCAKLYNDNILEGESSIEKINDINYSISDGNLLNDKYILIQKGKRNYFLVIIK